MSFGYFGIKQSVREIRQARAALKRLRTGVQRKGIGKKEKWELQGQIRGNKSILREAIVSIFIRGAVGLGMASVGTCATIDYLSSAHQAEIAQTGPTAKHAELIRRILFDQKQHDLSALVKYLQKDHSKEEIDLIVQEIRTRVEEEFKKEAQAVIADKNKQEIMIWGERIELLSPMSVERANQVLRKIGSDKRIFFGIIYSADTGAFPRQIVYGKIRREDQIGEKDKFLIVLEKGGAVVKSQIPGNVALNGVNSTLLIENALWELIEKYYKFQSQETGGIQYLAKELFKSCDISSYQQLKDHEQELLNDFGKFILAHERGHFETIDRLGSAHRGLLIISTPQGILPAGIEPVSYFNSMDELVADLAGLQHLARLAQSDPIRGRKLILFYALFSADLTNFASIDTAIYRTLGFAVVQSALVKTSDGNLKIDFERLIRSVARARQLAEKDLRDKTQIMRNQVRESVGANKSAQIEKETRTELEPLGVPDKQFDQFITQNLYFSLSGNLEFSSFNAVWQYQMISAFVGLMMNDPDVVGPIAGRYGLSNLIKDRVDELLR